MAVAVGHFCVDQSNCLSKQLVKMCLLRLSVNLSLRLSVTLTNWIKRRTYRTHRLPAFQRPSPLLTQTSSFLTSSLLIAPLANFIHHQKCLLFKFQQFHVVLATTSSISRSVRVRSPSKIITSNSEVATAAPIMVRFERTSVAARPITSVVWWTSWSLLTLPI